jgi:hypothetical protein
LSSEEKAKI